MLLILKALYLVAGGAISLSLIALVLRSKRRLDKRVTKFREEIEERGGAPLNPYLALAELYAEDERKNREAQQRRERQ